MDRSRVDPVVINTPAGSDRIILNTIEIIISLKTTEQVIFRQSVIIQRVNIKTDGTPLHSRGMVTIHRVTFLTNADVVPGIRPGTTALPDNITEKRGSTGRFSFAA